MIRKDLLFLFAEWNDHGNPLPVNPVFFSKKILEISFFELYRSKNICGCQYSKYQVSDRHNGRRPKRDQESNIKRVTNQFIKGWRAEW